MMRLLIIIELS